MSYVRAGENSDVYVFPSKRLGIEVYECCGCCIARETRAYGDWLTRTAEQMIDHLQEHRKKGHRVPQEAIERLKKYPFYEPRRGARGK